MKNFTLIITSILAVFATTTVYAETSSLQTTTSWRATAIKKPQSELGVTPLNPLHFEFADNGNQFKTQNGAFDITIKDVEGATDFKLTTKIVSNELRNTADNSVLTVNTNWNGKSLSSHNETTILDNQKGINRGLVVSNNAEKSELKNIQNAFLFNIMNETKTAQLASLPDGNWEGTLRIEFTSKWSGDFVTLASR